MKQQVIVIRGKARQVFKIISLLAEKQGQVTLGELQGRER